MNLYLWRSHYLSHYTRGYLIATGETPDAARQALRANFAVDYHDRRGDPTDSEDAENYSEALSLFEADIAGEPFLLPGVVFIEGSE